ncbi:hypothetical protein Rvan_2771 [Rhodomicrobium vannielii ATCC 17100]|uniref:Helix-turn-helix domain-containing protein n=1 Tax=Rhodomicrobium vannielii (strain ATCC 17100 / DSM 162 / LMG 4299 / NCIMB 10020 / ATH 3.1.1) TaxID=648757 RepID=E3I855_RHOVT|nr:hypothetical protein Rvan_2771 [Rhodomicrobium vannielii ATCC 17100]
MRRAAPIIVPEIEPLGVSPREAARLIGVSLPTLARLVGEGRITPPLRLAPRCPRFDLAKLREDWARLGGSSVSKGVNPWDSIL